MALHYVSHKFEKLFTNESVVGLFPVQADNKTHLFLTKTYSWIWGTWHTFWRGGVSACLIGMKSHTESTCRIFTHFDYAPSSVPTSDISFFCHGQPLLEIFHSTSEFPSRLFWVSHVALRLKLVFNYAKSLELVNNKYHSA